MNQQEAMRIKTLVVGPLMVNCYIVACEKTGKAALIDPGEDKDYILQTFRESGYELEKILLTHGHVDHITVTADIKQILGGEICAHQKDEFLILHARQQAEMFGLHIPNPFQIDRFVEDGDSLHIGELTFHILETPGHTPGGISLLVNECLFAGDTLFYDSIGRTDLIGGSYEQLISSIQKKLMILPPETKVYPGHGQATTIGREKQHNPFLSDG